MGHPILISNGATHLDARNLLYAGWLGNSAALSVQVVLKLCHSPAKAHRGVHRFRWAATVGTCENCFFIALVIAVCEGKPMHPAVPGFRE
jgi:hypothetical protein